MKNIVTIGGGTGSYTVLSGLKNLENVSLSALVSMADNGGSTGILRDELGVLPPGDVRQCLVALSEHSEIVRKLMNYRFSEGGLAGHSFGNLFLAALEKVTGDFIKGVEIASEILKVKGNVIPITSDKAELSILLSDKTLFEGVTTVDSIDFQKASLKRIFYKNENVKLNKNAKDAILKADYIIVGPGNYFCSVVPNFIVTGFKEAIDKSKAKIIFPVNLTNKKEHTKDWKISDYVKNVENYLGKPVDFIIINTEKPTKEQIENYRLEEGSGVLVKDDLEDERVIKVPLLSHLIFKYDKSDVKSNVRSFIRHDSKKIAECVENLIKRDNIKLIFDFDDTLFNTAEFKKSMFSSIKKAGISYSIAEDNYKKIRSLDTPFSLKVFLSLLFSQGKKWKTIGNLYEKIMADCPSFLNKKLINVVSKMGKFNCYIVTNGDEEFQLDKIKRSGIDSFFDTIDIVPGSKKKNIEQICRNNPNSLVIFIDDKKKFFDDLDMGKCHNLKTVLFNGNNVEDILEEINRKI